MFRKKIYGQSRIDKCPFCGKTATTTNKQKIPTCLQHKDKTLDNLRCACGDYLDLKNGKFGVYFNCMHCGNINFKKGLEMNNIN